MFRLVERPTLMPAQSLTGSTVGPMVDTGRILHNGGRVYVTEVEGWEIVNKCPNYDAQVGMRAEELGWASPADVRRLRDTVAELRAELAAAESGQPKVVSLDDALKLVGAAAA